LDHKVSKGYKVFVVFKESRDLRVSKEFAVFKVSQASKET
jgi:hypothetical protein